MQVECPQCRVPVEVDVPDNGAEGIVCSSCKLYFEVRGGEHVTIVKSGDPVPMAAVEREYDDEDDDKTALSVPGEPGRFEVAGSEPLAALSTSDLDTVEDKTAVSIPEALAIAEEPKAEEPISIPGGDLPIPVGAAPEPAAEAAEDPEEEQTTLDSVEAIPQTEADPATIPMPTTTPEELGAEPIPPIEQTPPGITLPDVVVEAEALPLEQEAPAPESSGALATLDNLGLEPVEELAIAANEVEDLPIPMAAVEEAVVAASLPMQGVQLSTLAEIGEEPGQVVSTTLLLDGAMLEDLLKCTRARAGGRQEADSLANSVVSAGMDDLRKQAAELGADRAVGVTTVLQSVTLPGGDSGLVVLLQATALPRGQ